ncbi:MAG: hypothetical protein ACR2RV_01600 [Verrucomicrobiales bacterium]
MARRARKGVESTQIIIIVAVVLALGGLAFFVASRSSDKFAKLTPLPIGEYMRNANSLSGNNYKLAGKVSAKARYTENDGQIIIVEVENGGSPVDLGVYVPVDLYGTNLDRGDDLSARVEVRGGGIIALLEIE